MDRQLICLDDEHISVDQMKMPVDRVLQCFIHNLPGPSSPLIENYLRETGFWHVDNIGRGCKLDPKLISTFVERWRPETHTFYLPCGECTITLEDVQLQLRLPMDESVLTESAQSADWGAICYDLLGKISETIYGGRIDMGQLRETFLVLGDDSTQVKRVRYARAYIPQILEGYLMPDKSQNLVHLMWLLKLIDFKAVGELSWGYGGIPTALEDIRLLLDQQLEAHFQWTPYEDSVIRAVIPDEFLQNPNIWHVRVPLVSYATVEMHQTDRVLQQFKFRHPIPMAHEMLDDEHKIDLQRPNTHWSLFHSEYIEIWENRIYGKPYLLSEEERRWQIRVEREQQGPLNPRIRGGETGPSTAPTQSLALTEQATMPTPQPLQIMPNAYPNSYVYPNPYMYPFSTPMLGWNVWPDASHFLMAPTQLMIYRSLSQEGPHEAPSGSSTHFQSPSPYGIQVGYAHLPWVMQTHPRSLFYQYELSSQHPQLEANPEQPQPRPEAEPRKNPKRNRQPPPCGIDSDRHMH
ncbi:hypothetical protein Gohar_004479 [Gossypium harknessii]|uniref:Aminotransferase-like plant mobile domain-containing protein n=1 Tax=Gossypium harknessii TaxID=34285 RepID=A0A7J9H7M0_9ROSI|nr:hypothetical protein [Gossypium harknessii]